MNTRFPDPLANRSLSPDSAISDHEDSTSTVSNSPAPYGIFENHLISEEEIDEGRTFRSLSRDLVLPSPSPREGTNTTMETTTPLAFSVERTPLPEESHDPMEAVQEIQERWVQINEDHAAASLALEEAEEALHADPENQDLQHAHQSALEHLHELEPLLNQLNDEIVAAYESLNAPFEETANSIQQTSRPPTASPGAYVIHNHGLYQSDDLPMMHSSAAVTPEPTSQRNSPFPLVEAEAISTEEPTAIATPSPLLQRLLSTTPLVRVIPEVLAEHPRDPELPIAHARFAPSK